MNTNRLLGHTILLAVLVSYLPCSLVGATPNEGSLTAWGYEHKASPPGTDFVAIASGSAHSVALRSDGSLAGWGYNVTVAFGAQSASL